MDERLWIAAENIREMILHGSASARDAYKAIGELILAANAVDEAEATAYTNRFWRQAT